MKAYSYNKKTREFIEEIDCQTDPLESNIQKKEIFLIPANSTVKKPPIEQEGKAIIFIDNNWEYITDHRGVYYNKDTKEKIINYTIEEQPENCTTLEPPTEYHVWDGEKWYEPLEVQQEKEKEDLINSKLREMAINELIKEGVLDKDGNIIIL